jgi:hypothetical protein
LNETFETFQWGIVASLVGLFVAMIVALEIGRRLGKSQVEAAGGTDTAQGSGALEAALFALLGLLIAFTFYGAAARFDERRKLIVEEVNDIGTAYLRVDVLPEDARPLIKEKFRQYLDSRIETYRRIPDMAAVFAEKERSSQLQAEIWNLSIGAAERSQSTAPQVILLPALNSMFDITTTREMATRMHPPTVIFVMLFTLVLATSLLAGHGMATVKKRSWLHILAFSITMILTVYVIFDVEYPRLGLIRVDSFDQALVDLRSKMN